MLNAKDCGNNIRASDQFMPLKRYELGSEDRGYKLADLKLFLIR